jgi:alanyl-tRNA synthetase
MTKNSLSSIRKEFLDFFSKQDHNIIQSSSLVPHNDNSLLFTNAGMVQFKNIFTGVNSPPTSKRAVTSQKCVRAGGKHNDLENVGLTKRHHTFFEMLGNFSFGDYFKEDAIEMAWNLITKNYGIDKDSLIITVYHTDNEAFDIWKKISGLSESKILRINTSDNFWEMGDTGPCGPCSEIFYDHGEEFSGGLPGSDNEGDRFVEIWNLVFMQFNKTVNGVKELLPSPSIDTGMGIERVAAVLQGTSDNYEIDTFRNIITKTQDIFKLIESNKTRIPLRIISDHLRAVCFLISDGVLPSNEGRGYVLRRILRRAIRHIYNLGIKEASFYKLVPILIEEMGEHYNELNIYKELVSNTIKVEEEKFLETIEKGLKILEEEELKNENSKIFSGKVAFKLYDTFGFPLDLTQDVLKSSNKKINLNEFDMEMNRQKEMSKKSWKGVSENYSEVFWNKVSYKMAPTEFIGYEILEYEEIIEKIIVQGEEVDKLEGVEEYVSLLFNKTPFYAEGGGQVGDKGVIENSNFKLEVLNTIKRADKVFEHYGKLINGNIKTRDKVKLTVNKNNRNKTTAHHSATHLLHSALRRNLGNHVTQKGSLVSESKLRFDISHNSAISEELIIKIEKDINEQIFSNSSVTSSILNKSEAIKKGAMAIFGEKYGDQVRVIEMGISNNNKAFSVELCGGTHVKRTGDIGLIKIISENSLASGVRRLEAVAGVLAIEEYRSIEHTLNNISKSLKTNQRLVEEKVLKLIVDKKEIEKEIKDIKSNKSDRVHKFDIKKINNIDVVSLVLKNITAKELKSIVDEKLKKYQKAVIILVSDDEKKVTLVIGLSDSLISKLDAANLVNFATPILGGNGGGGRKTLAQGGGTLPKEASKAIRAIEEEIKKQLTS